MKMRPMVTAALMDLICDAPAACVPFPSLLPASAPLVCLPNKVRWTESEDQLIALTLDNIYRNKQTGRSSFFSSVAEALSEGLMVSKTKMQVWFGSTEKSARGRNCVPSPLTDP